MKRMVYGISSWPESFEEEFPICEVLPNETDEQAIERAKELYNTELVCVIHEIKEN